MRQCPTLSSITITLNKDENVFVHMQWHANEGKKYTYIYKKKTRVDLSSVLHMHVHICTHKDEELSHRLMINRLVKRESVCVRNGYTIE